MVHSLKDRWGNNINIISVRFCSQIFFQNIGPNLLPWNVIESGLHSHKGVFAGVRLNIKMSSYQFRDFYFKNNTAGNSQTWKKNFYWNGIQALCLMLRWNNSFPNLCWFTFCRGFSQWVGLQVWFSGKYLKIFHVFFIISIYSLY